MSNYRTLKMMIAVWMMAVFGAGGAWGQAGNPPFFQNMAFNSTFVPQDDPIIKNPGNLVITLMNPAGTAANVTFPIQLGPGLKYAGNNGGFCATLTPNPAGTTVTFSGTLAAFATCTFSFDVYGIVAGRQTATAGPIVADGVPNTNPIGTPQPGAASSQIDVIAPLGFAKLFDDVQIAQCLRPDTLVPPPIDLCPTSATTKLTFTITNADPAGVQPITNISFTDGFPGGFIAVARNTNFSAAGCGALTPPTPGATSVSYAGISLASGAQCVVSFNVVGRSPGTRTNSASGTSNQTNPFSSTRTLTVVAPPQIQKLFSPSSIKNNVAGASSMVFTLLNPNTASGQTLHALNFMDDLTALGIVVTTPGSSTVCGGSLITTSKLVTFIGGGPLVALGSCTIVIPVTGTTPGVWTNTTSVIKSTEGDGNIAVADINVLAPPVLTKTFSATYGCNVTIAGISMPCLPQNGIVTATFILTNPNKDGVNPPGGASGTLTTVSMTDTLPPGLIVAPATNSSITCSGGTGSFAPAPGDSSLTVSVPTFTSNGSCTIKVDLAGIGLGQQTNIATPKSGNAGDGNPSPRADCYIVKPLTITKTFPAPKTIKRTTGATTDFTPVTFVITNSDPIVPQTQIAFKDTFPLGMVVATPAGVSNPTCGGTFSPASGDKFVQLSAGGPLNPNTQCTIMVNVGSTVGGLLMNTTDPILSKEGGPGNFGQDKLTVISPPLMTKKYAPTPILPGSVTTLTFVITNPSENTVTLTGVGFVDVLSPSSPGAVVVATPNNIQGSCNGVSPNAPPGSGSIILVGATLPVNSSCTFSVDVTGTVVGDFLNSATPTSTNGGPGDPATDTLRVKKGDLVLSKVFGASTIVQGGSTSLTIVITNPNAIPITNVAVSDAVPSGLTASPTGTTALCSGSLNVAPNSIILTNAKIAAGGTCVITVTVTAGATATGIQHNVAGPATSTETNPSPQATADITITTPQQLPPTLKKDFLSQSVLPGGTVALRFTLSNSNSFAISGISFTDTLPNGFLVATPNALMDGCTPPGTTSAPVGTATITVAGVNLSAGGVCTITLNVLAPSLLQTPVYICNTTSLVTSTLPVGLGDGPPAASCITVGNQPIAPPGAFQIRYASNLDKGDSIINLSNNGSNGAPLNGPGFGYPVGNICVNAYVFSPDEQLISCCSTLITPNGLNSLSVVRDLVSNTLTGIRPNSVVIKLLASQPMGSMCSPALPTFNNFATGMHAWGTTLHAAPVAGTFATTETPFADATLSAGELASITNRCTNIIGNGSTFGQCRTAGLGGLAPTLR